MEKENVLLVTIVERGFAEVVMDAARNRGAKGGTIIHGKGSGTKEMEKFFNIILHEEKEVVLIACQKHNKNDIMEGILKEAGLSSDAHGVLFSLPLEDFNILSKNTNLPNGINE